ncbi:MAG: ACT domain-containing protein [Pyrinomonadaceae bacterium]
MNPTELLRQTRIEVAPESFFLISMRYEDWLTLLENPELSPRGTAPFMILRDSREVTLLLDEVDYGTIRHMLRDAKTEGVFRMLAFNIELNWDVVGYFALISKILAEAEIPIGAISAFSRDHLLIKQQDLPKALKVLGKYVAELC